MLLVVKNFASHSRSFKVIRNYTVCKFLLVIHCRLKYVSILYLVYKTLDLCLSCILSIFNVDLVLTLKSGLGDRSRSLITSSSAVPERPRDASCLSVVSFNSTIPRAQFSIISYTSALDLRLPTHTIKLYSILFGEVVHVAGAVIHMMRGGLRSIRTR